MIDKRELRIGNKILLAHESNAPIVTVLELGDSLLASKHKWHSYDLCLPIPLTPAILEKCGFKYEDEHKWYVWQPELENFEIRVLELPFSYGDWHISKGFMSWNDELRDVKHLHELQNTVYFGLGYEININL